MPMYPWKCDKCDAITDAIRSMENIDLPPDSCDSCGSTTFKERIIVRPENCKGYILVDSGLGWPSHGFYSKPYWPEKKR